MSASVVVALKTLFITLVCLTFALDFWAIGTDGLAPCVDLSSRWLDVTLINFYINLALIGAWIFYKESSWIRAAVIMLFVFFAGSIISCGYIALQLFKLSPEESSKDPLYYVLARHQKKDVIGKRTGPYVNLSARVIISALGCLALGAFIYVLIVDGSPFRSQVFTRCMIATTTDVFFIMVTLSVWVAYRESNWTSVFFWILSLICFGSIATCVYIVRQLFYLSPQQPISLVLFNNSRRDKLPSSDPLLIAHAIV